MDRRNTLLGMTGLTGLAGLPLTASAAAPNAELPKSMAREQVVTEMMPYADEVEKFKAHFRMERDLAEEEGECVAWYYWIAYVVPENTAPQPLVRFEGMEYSYFRKVAENTYRIHAHNVSFPRDLETNEFVSKITNPVTGEVVDIPPTVLLNDPGTVHSPKGFRNLRGNGSYVQPFRKFRRENDMVRFESVRTAPPNWPVKHMESTIQWCDLKSFNDPSITSIPSRSSGVYVFGYPEWFQMGERGGSMLGFIDGLKIRGVQDLPDSFAGRMKAEYPKLLEARWGEFDRPAPFKYEA